MTVRFRAPVEYNRRLDSGARPALLSRYAGMPVGVQFYSDWNVHYLPFQAAGDVPINGTDWTVTQTAVAQGIAISSDITPPHIIVTNDGDDNDLSSLQWTAANGAGEYISFLAPGPRVYFETMVRFRDANNDADTVEQMDFFAGFCITDTAVNAGATDFIGFKKIDATATGGTSSNGLVVTPTDDEIYFVSGLNAGAAGELIDDYVGLTGWDMTMTGLPAADQANTLAGRTLRRASRHVGPNDWVKLAFLVEPGSDIAATNEGAAFTWVNNGSPMIHNLATTAGAGQVPDEQLCFTIEIQNGEGVAKILDIAYVLIAQEYDMVISNLGGE